MRTNSPVCIAIPIYKAVLSASEQFSIAMCRRVLSTHPIKFIAPNHFADDRPSYLQSDDELICFGTENFVNLRAYNSLLLSEEFWSRFSAFRYMLMYQPDSLVFRDELMKWVDTGLSYVGAPWLKWIDGEAVAADIGNGGFSLRDIQAHLRVLRSSRVFLTKTVTYKGARHFHILAFLYLAWSGSRLGLPIRWGRLLAKLARIHEDVFWGMYAQCFEKRFLPAEPGVALRFAFDRFPEQCFRLAGHKLPFGCHAWQAGGHFWPTVLADTLLGSELTSLRG